MLGRRDPQGSLFKVPFWAQGLNPDGFACWEVVLALAGWCVRIGGTTAESSRTVRRFGTRRSYHRGTSRTLLSGSVTGGWSPGKAALGVFSS